MNIIRRIAAVVGCSILTAALVPGAAHAAAPEAVPTQPAAVTKVVETTVIASDLAPALSSVTSARPGEGVIRITTRICGNARNWQNVAAANGIKPPVYLVLLGQRITVACVGGSAPAPAAQQAPAPPAVSASGWVNPVPGLCLSGYPNTFRSAGRPTHDGVDIAGGNGGQAIRAASAGTVSTSWEAGAGNYSIISHGGGLFTVYMHQSRFAVRSGWVNVGQVIGYVGATGNAHGAHLHFEVHTRGAWNDGGKVDPVSFMAARGARLGC